MRTALSAMLPSVVKHTCSNDTPSGNFGDKVAPDQESLLRVPCLRHHRRPDRQISISRPAHSTPACLSITFTPAPEYLEKSAYSLSLARTSRVVRTGPFGFHHIEDFANVGGVFGYSADLRRRDECWRSRCHC